MRHVLRDEQRSVISEGRGRARPLRVLHVLPTLRRGGMELALGRITNGLAESGMGHTVVALKGSADAKDRFDARVRIVELHAERNEASVPLQLKALIQKERPTVIHARNLGAWPEVSLARLLCSPKTPLVFSFHGLADSGPVPVRWRLASQVLARLTTRLLTVSEASRGFLARLVGLPPSRIAVIPNGVDTQSFAPPAKRAANAPLVVGTAGSLTAVKNHALLLRAVANLHRGGIEARLLIAGEGPLRRDLERLIETQGATSRVRLLGHVHSMPDFLRSLDLFVLPSDSEAHPNALTEAMACGRACIATRVGGVAEITDDGRAAVLVDRGDEQGLTDALARLLTKDALRETLGHRAASLARERYSMSRMLESYRDLYCSLS